IEPSALHPKGPLRKLGNRAVHVARGPIAGRHRQPSNQSLEAHRGTRVAVPTPARYAARACQWPGIDRVSRVFAIEPDPGESEWRDLSRFGSPHDVRSGAMSVGEFRRLRTIDRTRFPAISRPENSGRPALTGWFVQTTAEVEVGDFAECRRRQNGAMSSRSS